jgi:hypothetical protein
MNIISRKEAKEKRLTRYFTGKPCPHGHISERYVYNWNCVDCNAEGMFKYLKNEKHREVRNERSRKWRKENLEKSKEQLRNWRHANPEKANALHAKRRASKLQRTPSWTNLEDIRMWYEVAEVLSRSGVKFHVDHVVPLQGKTVSGFHVENNMQVIPSYLNVSKNNQWNWEIQSHE